MKDGNAFITEFGYLSIDKSWIDTTMQKVVVVNGNQYNVDQLKNVISYRDNRDWYRWKPSAYDKAYVGDA